MLLPPPPPAADAIAADTPEAEPARPPRTLLPWALKVGLAVVAIGFGATHYLSRAVDEATQAGYRLEARRAAIGQDPETTGSIGPAAGRVTLDPCTTLSGPRVR